MTVTYQQEDQLDHIANEDSLSARAASVAGCITLFSIGFASLEVCYSVNGDSVYVKVTLKTPVGDVDLGSATLDANNPSVTLGGGIAGFKAEVTLTLHLNVPSLEICGKLCAPWVGCTSGCFTINF